MKASSTAGTAEAYLVALDEPRQSDISRLHERIRERHPGMRAYVDRGFSCIRFKRLDDLDLAVVDEIVAASAANDGKRLES